MLNNSNGTAELNMAVIKPNLGQDHHHNHHNHSTTNTSSSTTSTASITGEIRFTVPSSSSIASMAQNPTLLSLADIEQTLAANIASNPMQMNPQLMHIANQENQYCNQLELDQTAMNNNNATTSTTTTNFVSGMFRPGVCSPPSTITSGITVGADNHFISDTLPISRPILGEKNIVTTTSCAVQCSYVHLDGFRRCSNLVTMDSMTGSGISSYCAFHAQNCKETRCTELQQQQTLLEQKTDMLLKRIHRLQSRQFYRHIGKQLNAFVKEEQPKMGVQCQHPTVKLKEMQEQQRRQAAAAAAVAASQTEKPRSSKSRKSEIAKAAAAAAASNLPTNIITTPVIASSVTNPSSIITSANIVNSIRPMISPIQQPLAVASSFATTPDLKLVNQCNHQLSTSSSLTEPSTIASSATSMAGVFHLSSTAKLEEKMVTQVTVQKSLPKSRNQQSNAAARSGNTQYLLPPNASPSAPTVKASSAIIVNRKQPMRRFSDEEAKQLYDSIGIMQTNLRQLEFDYDSDATLSSSGGESGDELDEIVGDYCRQNHKHHPYGTCSASIPLRRRANWNWCKERSAIAARWSWLQAQVADLEFKIRQQNEMYRQLRNSKGPISLYSPPQPINKNVVSLTPLPPSNSSQTLPSATIPSSQSSNEPFVPPTGVIARPKQILSSSLKQTATAISSDDDAPSSCVRTLPLKHMRKRKLVNAQLALCTSGPRRPGRHATVLCGCASLPAYASPCVLCGGRLNYVQMIDTDYMPRSERLALLDAGCHPVLSLPTDTALGLHFSRLLKRETVQRPVGRQQGGQGDGRDTDSGSVSKLNNKRKKPANVNNEFGFKLGKELKKKKKSQAVISSAKLKKKYDQDRSKKKLTAAGNNNTAKNSIRQALKRTGKLKQRNRSPSGSGDSTTRNDSPLPSPLPGNATGGVGAGNDAASILQRRRRSEQNAFDINNIVIPYSIASTTRVEKLQYKEIITPKWRVMEMEQKRREAANLRPESSASGDAVGNNGNVSAPEDNTQELETKTEDKILVAVTALDELASVAITKTRPVARRTQSSTAASKRTGVSSVDTDDGAASDTTECSELTNRSDSLEDLSDEIFIERHLKCEADERRRFTAYLKQPGMGGGRGRAVRQRTESTKSEAALVATNAIESSALDCSSQDSFSNMQINLGGRYAGGKVDGASKSSSGHHSDTVEDHHLHFQPQTGSGKSAKTLRMRSISFSRKSLHEDDEDLAMDTIEIIPFERRQFPLTEGEFQELTRQDAEADDIDRPAANRRNASSRFPRNVHRVLEEDEEEDEDDDDNDNDDDDEDTQDLLPTSPVSTGQASVSFSGKVHGKSQQRNRRQSRPEEDDLAADEMVDMEGISAPSRTSMAGESNDGTTATHSSSNSAASSFNDPESEPMDNADPEWDPNK